MPGNTAASVQSNQTFYTSPVPIAVGVLNPANSPQTVWDCGVGMTYAAMTTVVTGSPASFTIVLEGTYDGSNWTTLATTTNVAGETQFSNGTIPFTNLRARCTAVSGGTSPTVNVVATASQTPFTQTTGGALPGTVVNQGATNLGLQTGWPVAVGAVSPTVAQNAQTTGNGTVVDFGSARGTVMWQIVPAGTITGGAVAMEISLDGNTWFTPPTANFTNYSGATLANPYVLVTGTNALFDLGAGNTAARYARARISSNVTGTGASVTVNVSGY